MQRVLLVEDESSIAEPLTDHLEHEGFGVETARSIEDARRALARSEPDVVLLDLMLPDGDGRDLCREIRRTSDVPIVMLTARGEEVDRIVGLELGADDYVVKPFSAGELVARIRAIRRRTNARSPGRPSRIAIGELTLDTATRTLWRQDDEIGLSAKEYDLLAFLMSRAGTVVRREEIMEEVWDRHWFGSTKTLDVHVSWLRKKLEDDAASPRYLLTVRGVGFRFVNPGEARGERATGGANPRP